MSLRVTELRRGEDGELIADEADDLCFDHLSDTMHSNDRRDRCSRKVFLNQERLG